MRLPGSVQNKMSVIFTILAVMVLAGKAFSEDISLSKRPSGNSFVYDYAQLLNEYSKSRLEAFLELFLKDKDIEFVGVSVENLSGESIDTWANKLFSNWKIGSRCRGARGLLLVIAPHEKEVRLEVGYDLEPIFTDGFVGYIEREQMKPFFELGKIGEGFEATLEMIVDHARKARQTGSDDPSLGSSLPTAGGYYSGGAGAKQQVAIGSVSAPVKDAAPLDVAVYFSAQPTPEATFERYREMLRRHIKDPNLGIFNSATQRFYGSWVVTNAQQDNELRDLGNAPYTANVNGDRAVICFSKNDRVNSPYFLERTPQGWQLDIATMSRVIRFDQNNFWHFVDKNHPYAFAEEN